MRFLMKMALDSITPMDTTSRHLPSSLRADTVSTHHLRINLHPRRILQAFWEKIIVISKLPVRSAPDSAVVPLIKATTKIECSTSSNSLAGKHVLCIGGREKFYPVYHHLVEALGGKLMTFRGNVNDNNDQLFERLVSADMVICPVDCVNHEAYFAVKYYCQCSGKHHVLLDRSQVSTFQKGISTLAAMNAKTVKS